MRNLGYYIVSKVSSEELVFTKVFINTVDFERVITLIDRNYGCIVLMWITGHLYELRPDPAIRSGISVLMLTRERRFMFLWVIRLFFLLL